MGYAIVDKNMKLATYRTQKFLVRGATIRVPVGKGEKLRMVEQFIPVLMTQYNRSKYMPHTGEKQRIKDLKRALKSGTARLDYVTD